MSYLIGFFVFITKTSGCFLSGLCKSSTRVSQWKSPYFTARANDEWL